jgi:hypothetical protein
MPLQLDYSKIDNWRDICLVDTPDGKQENPFNFTMGIFMMHTGIQTITRKNASEFYMRAKLIEVCFGLQRESVLLAPAQGRGPEPDRDDGLRATEPRGGGQAAGDGRREAGPGAWPDARQLGQPKTR